MDSKVREKEKILERKKNSAEKHPFLNKKFLILILVLFLAGSLFLTLKNSKKPKNHLKESKITLKVIKAEVKSISDSVKLTGTVLPCEEIKISPRLSGDIVAIYHDSGSFVRSGDVLAKIDDSALQISKAAAYAEVLRTQGVRASSRAGIDIAKSNLTIAESNYRKAESDKNRYQYLNKEGAVSALDFDKTNTDYEVALANYKRAQADLQQAVADYKEGLSSSISGAGVKAAVANYNAVLKQISDCSIRTMTNGYVVKRNIKLGNRVTPTDVAFVVVKDNQLELQAKIAEADLIKLTTGIKALITSSVDSNLNVIGTIRKIEPYVDPTTRMGLVRIALPFSKKIDYGMFLNAEIKTASKKTVVVPEESVVFKNNKYIVFKVDEKNVVHETEVKPGMRNSGIVEILKGLEPNSLIVKEGGGFLYDGDKISITK